MRADQAPPTAVRGQTARTRRDQGLTEVITLGGDLVLRTPRFDAAARRRLEAWGLRLERGSPPPARRSLALGTPFQHRVWRACRLIPPGVTVTYGELARRVGCGSARAVGQALGANPLARLIPCHRVTAAHGPGGFAWGLERKRRWLTAEADGTAR